jgi:hypothetical protein
VTTFPGSPKSLKGAIVAINVATKQIVSTIAFQYNPDTITRTLNSQISGGENGAKSETLRIKGAPVETIKLDVELDATDQLEKADKITSQLGIYPQLSALETLIYPSTTQIFSNMQKAGIGMIEIIPMEAPLTLLIWGKKRVLPVVLNDFSITEEAYDVNLNPIRAKVSLSLRVLNYSDLPWNMSGKLFHVHHQIKEKMGNIGSISNLASMAKTNINLFI